ncbi:MAG: Fe-S cluster assembly protein SufD [Cyanothece sp. SIO1E1]|nr:Fe-S cluster assembly protein SufD [Cyanothece sp. SIO1E1]
MNTQVSSTAGSHPEESQIVGSRDGYLMALLERVAQTTHIESSSQSLSSSHLALVREHAKALVRQQHFPSTRDETWRFTNLAPLLAVEFAAAEPQPPAFSLAALDDFTLPETTGSRLVFINGTYAPELSSITNLPAGVFAGNLEQANADATLRSQIDQYLAQQPGSDEIFTALNTVGFRDVAVVWVPKHQVIEQPIQLLFVAVAGTAPTLSNPRCLLVAETNSAVNLVEDYIGLGAVPQFTNAVTEIWVSENAQINHSRIQRDGSASFHIGKTAISQARDSRYTCNAITLGAKLSRHYLEIGQTGRQTETTLNGLTVIGEQQLADTQSAIAFTQPHGSADQLHKCIIADQAHAVFNGKVFVPQAAQLTNASQLNRNLLLSAKARVDTKPQLEIVADNVKCAHGATVSQLDADEVFYLQSRGIDKASSQRLLIHAFALEIINRIPISSLRDNLTRLVTERSD